MTDQQDPICPLDHPGHPDRPSIAAPGSRLCKGHERAVDDRLVELATFSRDADQAEHDGALGTSSAPPLSGSKEQPLPYSDALADHRQRVRGVLASWSLLVAEERGVEPPAEPEPNRMVDFLRRHHDWAVGQDWADDYAGEILELGRRAWSLLHPSGVRRFPVGQCVEVYDGVRCPGTLWALLTPADPYAEAGAFWACDECGARVESSDWLVTGRRIKAMGEAA